jgi:serine/threonine protein kinase
MRGCFSGDSDSEPDFEFDTLPRNLRWKLKFGGKKVEVHDSATIIRLGDKRILKKGVESTEYEALRLVNEKTSVPVPRVLGVYNTREGVLVDLEVVPGRTVDTVWNSLSPAQKNKHVSDLGRFIDQLRKLPAPKREVIGSTSMGANHDPRFGKKGIGPFYSVNYFHEFIRRGHPLHDFREEELQHCHGRQYEIKFTHADLCPQNILVDDNGRITAILDWESAGWYPEYWEYTQMHFATPNEMKDWLAAVENVVKRYDNEMVAEAVMRQRFAASAYDCARSVRAPSPTRSELERERKEIDDKNTESTSG